MASRAGLNSLAGRVWPPGSSLENPAIDHVTQIIPFLFVSILVLFSISAQMMTNANENVSQANTKRVQVDVLCQLQNTNHKNVLIVVLCLQKKTKKLWQIVYLTWLFALRKRKWRCWDTFEMALVLPKFVWFEAENVPGRGIWSCGKSSFLKSHFWAIR